MRLGWIGSILAAATFVGAAAAPEPLTLSTATGETVRLFEADDERLTVVVFILHDCPISNAYAREVERLHERWRDLPVRLFVASIDPDYSAEQARAHAEEYGYTCAVLMDTRHKLVARAGATIVPEAAVFDGRHALRYLGRIDDRFVDFGVQRAEPTEHNLRDAVDALLAGQAPPKDRAPALGCDIPPLD